MSSQNVRPPRDFASGSSGAAKDSGSLGQVTPRFGIAVGVFLLILFSIILYLRPEVVQLTEQIAGKRDAILALQIQADSLKIRIEENRQARAKFAVLEENGMFAEQKKLSAIRQLEDLRQRYRITSLQYQILPAVVTQIGTQDTLGMSLVTSRIILNVRGFMDSDLIAFVEAIRMELPGHVVVEAFEINKLASPGAASLARIRSGAGADMVSGVVTLSWRAIHNVEKVAER